MNISEIMEKLQKDYIWASGEQDAPELEPCPFCGQAGMAQIIVSHPPYGKSGAWIRCRYCGACGPHASERAQFTRGKKLCTPVLPESLERGITAAVDTWNSGVVDRSRLSNLRMEVATV